MTQQNAPVLDKHRDEAAKAAGYRDWEQATATWLGSDYCNKSILPHAQALANLEAANNRLAEINRLLGMYSCSDCDVARDLASGHTPSPCPSCAAKDEAMAAFKAEVSDAIQEYCGGPKYVPSGSLSRFIIPPADPVADALKEAIDAYHEAASSGADPFPAALAELKSRLPLGGAK